MSKGSPRQALVPVSGGGWFVTSSVTRGPCDLPATVESAATAAL
jgi:hypothetical protein